MNEMEILKRLKKEYPNVRGTALNYSNPLELLIATILSAQTTDKRVNMVTKGLFKKYKNARDYARADIKELQEMIKSVNFYKNKAKYIKEGCRIIDERYNGNVPDSMEELIKLPGVSRKTANVVLSNAFRKDEGIVVDTHVIRLSKRLGLTKENDRNKIEQDLMKKFPKEEWFDLANLLIVHGRQICKAKNPDCENCVLKDICPYYKEMKKKT
ncbi:MAG: endonuclease III [Thermoplasmata archaeon]|nr:endonuclease III [Thermoplasmata archaeon]